MKRALQQHRNLGSLWNAFIDAHPNALPQVTTVAELVVWSHARSQHEFAAASLRKVHLFGRGVERGEA